MSSWLKDKGFQRKEEQIQRETKEAQYLGLEEEEDVVKKIREHEAVSYNCNLIKNFKSALPPALIIKPSGSPGDNKSGQNWQTEADWPHISFINVFCSSSPV